MADWVKMAIKGALIATVTALLLVLLTSITVPSFDLTIFSQGIGIAKAIGEYYIPGFPVLAGIFVGLLGLNLLSYTLYLGIIAIRWVFVVNE